MLSELSQRTKLIGSFEQPVHLARLLLGMLVQPQWTQLHIQIQPLLNTDTIIKTLSQRRLISPM